MAEPVRKEQIETPNTSLRLIAYPRLSLDPERFDQQIRINYRRGSVMALLRAYDVSRGVRATGF